MRRILLRLIIWVAVVTLTLIVVRMKVNPYFMLGLYGSFLGMLLAKEMIE